jgi:alpha-L-fucosidase 2
MKYLRLLFIITLVSCAETITFAQNKIRIAAATGSPAGTFPKLDAYDVQYDEPGPGSAQSMPIGNGDIGLNVWVEPDGSLNFYISKTDAWGDQVTPGMDPWMRQGGILSKLGKIRISFTPQAMRPGSFFRQVLRLGNGEIDIREGEGSEAIHLRIWVDANHPVIRVEAQSTRSAAVKVTLVDWRLQKGDSILTETNDRITWFHRNRLAGDPALPDSALAGRIFGASIRAHGLRRRDDSTLLSVMDTGTWLISIFPLTTVTGTPRDWLDRLDRQATAIGRLDLENTRRAHQAWWHNFWSRSWINVSGDSTAWYTTRGTILQRWVTACAGRGNYPIKFNGSIFTVDNPDWRSGGHASPQDPDFRAWGGQYWFQNTRPMYWPRLMAGDFDMMLPLFRMYAAMIPGNAALVRKYYGHEGAYFQETSPFWGGIPYMGPEVKENYTAHYFTPILELSFMMLDYYDYTGDRSFVRDLLLPIATAGLRFFDSHFGRDAEGRLLLDPDNSIEMFWKVHDPAPDIAGLKAVLTRMIALPDGIVDAAERSRWQRLLAALPELPKGTLSDLPKGSRPLLLDSARFHFPSDLPVLLPYTGPQTAHAHNLENPELYAVYPFRLYGPGRPHLQLAKNTFETRKFREKGCWNQDPIQAAMLGYADIAREYVAFALTRKDPRLKFPAFWDRGHDYEPDEDNGGNGENGLQKMLLQTDGRKIFLLPAWPQGWDADFKLHAPYGTIIQGKVVNGRLKGLVVTPAARAADVVDCSKNPGVIGH